VLAYQSAANKKRPSSFVSSRRAVYRSGLAPRLVGGPLSSTLARNQDRCYKVFLTDISVEYFDPFYPADRKRGSLLRL
jgi:hypothetical protein